MTRKKEKNTKLKFVIIHNVKILNAKNTIKLLIATSDPNPNPKLNRKQGSVHVRSNVRSENRPDPKVQPCFRPVGVAVSVVIAEQVVFSHHLVPGNLQRLVHRREEVLAQTGHQINEVTKVPLNLLGRQTPHQIQGTV